MNNTNELPYRLLRLAHHANLAAKRCHGAARRYAYAVKTAAILAYAALRPEAIWITQVTRLDSGKHLISLAGPQLGRCHLLVAEDPSPITQAIQPAHGFEGPEAGGAAA